MRIINFFLFMILLIGLVNAIPTPSYFFNGSSLTSEYGTYTFTNRNSTVLGDSVQGHPAYNLTDTLQQGLNGTSFSMLNYTKVWAFASCFQGSTYLSTDALFGNRIIASNFFVIDIANSGGLIRTGIYNGTAWIGGGVSSGVLQNNTPYCIVVNNYGSSIDMYLNGTNQTGTTTPNTPGTDNTATIGFLTASSYYFNGDIWYVALFNQTLNTTEIATLNNISWQPTTCTTPTAGMVITTNTTFCAGTYTLNHSSKDNIIINNTVPIVIDCNGATIQGDYATNFTYGFIAQKDNIEIKNCNIKGYSVAIYAVYYSLPAWAPIRNLSIHDNNISRIGGLAGVFTDGVINMNFYNNRCYDFNDYGERSIGVHCLYSSGGNDSKVLKSGNIYNNNITNVTASGIKFNSVNGVSENINIYNNNCSAFSPSVGDDYCIHLAETNNISVYNNLCKSGVDACIVLNVGTNTTKWAHNTLIYQNNFSNLVTGLWFRTGNEYNISVYNNIYPSNLNNHIRIKNNDADATANFKFYNETSTVKMCKAYNTCKMNFTNVRMNYVTVKLY